MFYQRIRLGILGYLAICSASAFADSPTSGVSLDEVKTHFDTSGKVVVTFLGYSGSGYEDMEAMLDEARKVLSVHSPRKTIVNIGATASGIGAVYELAKKMGFETTGIVSTQAKQQNVEVSPAVDKVFFVTDASWGGFLENTKVLSPTSQAMVNCSDVIICIGGGPVARDELIAAQRGGKTTKFIPADMNHKMAIEKARKKGQPIPTDFRGAAFAFFGKPSQKPIRKSR